MKKASRTKISSHKTNFEDYITKYAQTGPHLTPLSCPAIARKGPLAYVKGRVLPTDIISRICKDKELR